MKRADILALAGEFVAVKDGLNPSRLRLTGETLVARVGAPYGWRSMAELTEAPPGAPRTTRFYQVAAPTEVADAEALLRRVALRAVRRRALPAPAGELHARIPGWFVPGRSILRSWEEQERHAAEVEDDRRRVWDRVTSRRDLVRRFQAAGHGASLSAPYEEVAVLRVVQPKAAAGPWRGCRHVVEFILPTDRGNVERILDEIGAPSVESLDSAEAGK